MHQILSPSLYSLRLTFSTCCEKYYDANSAHPKSSTSNPNDSVLSAWCCAYAYACTHQSKTHIYNTRSHLRYELLNPPYVHVWSFNFAPKIPFNLYHWCFFFAVLLYFIRLAELKTRIMCMRFVYMFPSFKQATPKAKEQRARFCD